MNIVGIIAVVVSSIILIYGLLSPAPWYVKVLLIIAIGIPLLCSTGEIKNR